MCSRAFTIFFPLWLHIYGASPLNYRDHPNDFVELFTNCVQNENCSFYYWHIAKTGGSTINVNFQNTFPNNVSENNCCADLAMRKFQENVEAYCRSKFSSYEVNGDQMLEIVETCTKLHPSSSAIVLGTYRDPISRFLSFFNYICNNLFETRPPRMQRVCAVCEYGQDKETQKVFKHMIRKANYLYLSQRYITKMNLKNVQVLLLDTMDLNRFLESQWLRSKFKVTTMKRNKGEIHRCSLGITYELFQHLTPSLEAYRNLSIGKY